jgi:uncharacterized OB-fold protein
MAEARPIANEDATTKPWWDGTREEKLLVQRCNACAHHQHYPRGICTSCGGADLGFVESSGRATVYSYTVVHRAPHPAFAPPYVVALVRLEEGPLLLTNIAGTNDVRCDMPVRVAWEPLEDGRKLPVFKGE